MTLELTVMATKTLTISYPEDLLLSLKESPEEFETEARLLLAVKLYDALLGSFVGSGVSLTMQPVRLT